VERHNGATAQRHNGAMAGMEEGEKRRRGEEGE